jgi:hypothetical protein
MCLRRAPERYIAGALAPAGAALDRAVLNGSDEGAKHTEQCVSGLCPSSRIEITRKQRFGNSICFST